MAANVKTHCNPVICIWRKLPDYLDSVVSSRLKMEQFLKYLLWPKVVILVFLVCNSLDMLFKYYWMQWSMRGWPQQFMMWKTVQTRWSFCRNAEKNLVSFIRFLSTWHTLESLKGISNEKMLPSDWPVEAFLDWWLVWEGPAHRGEGTVPLLGLWSWMV